MWVEYWGICARKWGREIETSLSRPKRRTSFSRLVESPPFPHNTPTRTRHDSVDLRFVVHMYLLEAPTSPHVSAGSITIYLSIYLSIRPHQLARVVSAEPPEPSLRFEAAKIVAARRKTRSSPHRILWSDVVTREDGETTQLRNHAARLEGGEGGVQRVFVWQIVSRQLVARKLVWR